MSNPTVLLPFQPSSMTSAQLAAVSYLARYSGPTHALYAAQLRRWFGWCEANELDPLVGIQRAHVELYIRQLGESGLMDSTGSSRPTPPCTPGSQRAIATSPAPKGWTGWS